MDESTALSILETLNPVAVFQTENGVEDIISRVERDVRAVQTDATTEKGRKHIKSLAYQVARSKTALDDAGKRVQADAKAIVDKVNADRRIISARLDALRDEVRKPADEYDAQEAARTDAHKAIIMEMEALGRFDFDPDESLVAARKDRLENLYIGRDFQEFRKRSRSAWDQVGSSLRAHADAAVARRLAREEAEARAAHEAEQARIRAEEERKAREAEIARQAAENAKREAEARAERDRAEAERKAKAEQDRAEREKRAAIAEAQEAERRRVEAEARAEREKREAVEAERHRIAAEEMARKADDDRRAADKAHKAKINREVLAALTGCGLSDDLAKAVIASVARGEVPHLSIKY